MSQRLRSMPRLAAWKKSKGQAAENSRPASWPSILVTRASIPLLKASRGLVVNLASIAGEVPTPGLSIYGAAKAAVIHFTRSLNAELEGDGVRATALCPGFVDTPMVSWTGLASEQMIQPEDCAEIVRLLLRLTPAARIPQVVVERLGSGSA